MVMPQSLCNVIHIPAGKKTKHMASYRTAKTYWSAKKCPKPGRPPAKTS